MRLGGALCLTSAALYHGWEVAQPPDRPHIAVARGRRIDRPDVRLHRHDLHPSQCDGVATSPVTTLEMCLRSLPFGEALAVADSFLRHDGSPAILRRIAASARGPGAPQMRRVAREASAEAANPFESVLRALALDVPGLRVRPQVWIRSRIVRARPDLVDEDLRIVLEADSFAWHGDRAALDRDAHRYNLLVADRWCVLRFSWEQVMLRPDEVRRVLGLVVRRHTEVATAGLPTA